MAKEKKIKVKKKIDWKHEMALAPGYIIVILWVAFTLRDIHLSGIKLSRQV